MNEVWYSQQKFAEWFEIQRERWRNKDIMPHMDSSDNDSDSNDDDSAPGEESSSDTIEAPPPPTNSPTDGHDNGPDPSPSSVQGTMGSHPDSDMGVERSPDQQVPPGQGPYHFYCYFSLQGSIT